MVPGKSWPICVRTGYVWHPIGIPSGVAPNTRAPAEINPVTAVLAAALLKKSLLELALIMVSIVSQFAPHRFDNKLRPSVKLVVQRRDAKIAEEDAEKAKHCLLCGSSEFSALR